MIRALFQETKQEGWAGFQIEGHADFADSGEDIVCAGVSSAVMLTLNLLSDARAEGTPEIKDNLIRYTVQKNSRATDLLIGGLCRHLQALSEEYPNNICVKSGR